jgi:hypothetical protein
MTPGRGRTARSVGTMGGEPPNKREDHQVEDLTSLRPPTPGPFQKSSVTTSSASPSGHHRRPSSHIYSSPPLSPPLSPWSHDSAALLRKQREQQRMLPDWYDDDDDNAEEEEEVVDEAELARRRAQVRVRRLPTITSRSRHHHPRSSSRRAEEEEEYSSSSFFVPTSPSRGRRTASPTPTTMTNCQQQHQSVQFKDQAMSVVVVPTDDVREEPLPTQMTTTSTTRPLPRPRHDTRPYHRHHPPPGRNTTYTTAPTIPRSPILPGAPNPDYQVQFKDQAQSLVVTANTSSPHHQQDEDYVHVPVAIAVPVFDDVETVVLEEDEHGRRSGRWTRSSQPRRRHGRGQVYEQAFL